jgi:uncharacterized protein YjbI with pentapeptide repeats
MMLHSNSVGNKIVAARKKMNLSQAELAQQISISPQAVGKWERGESMPDISTLNRIAEILGVDLNYFSDSFGANPKEEVQQTVSKVQNDGPSSTSGKKPDWNWDMSRGNWTDSDFSGLKNLKEKFSSSNMKNCKFLNAELSGLILEKNNIELCDFSGSDLRDSKIKSSNVTNNQFIKCSFIDSEIYKSNVEKSDFSGSDFSGAELLESNLEYMVLNDVVWSFTKFLKSNLSHLTFAGTFGNCHFESCSFYNTKFENATLKNTFFKYNDKFKKVQFINCTVDNITYAFLKNNQADLSGVTLLS